MIAFAKGSTRTSFFGFVEETCATVMRLSGVKFTAGIVQKRCVVITGIAK